MLRLLGTLFSALPPLSYHFQAAFQTPSDRRGPSGPLTSYIMSFPPVNPAGGVLTGVRPHRPEQPQGGPGAGRGGAHLPAGASGAGLQQGVVGLGERLWVGEPGRLSLDDREWWRPEEKLRLVCSTEDCFEIFLKSDFRLRGRDPMRQDPCPQQSREPAPGPLQHSAPAHPSLTGPGSPAGGSACSFEPCGPWPRSSGRGPP